LLRTAFNEIVGHEGEWAHDNIFNPPSASELHHTALPPDWNTSKEWEQRTLDQMLREQAYDLNASGPNRSRMYQRDFPVNDTVDTNIKQENRQEKSEKGDDSDSQSPDTKPSRRSKGARVHMATHNMGWSVDEHALFLQGVVHADIL